MAEASIVSTTPRRRPTWASVVGTLSIVLAAQLLLPLQRLVISVGSVTIGYPLGGLDSWIWLLLGGQVLVAILLLLSGILTLRQKMAALPLAMWYAVGQLLLLIICAGVTASMISGAPSPPSDAVMQVGGERIALEFPRKSTLYVLAFVGLLPYAIYPVFLLYWFNRRRIKEQVKSWTPRPEGAAIIAEDLPFDQR